MFKFLKSTILIKIVMALTGLAIVAFLFLHAIGNLQFWIGPDAYNTYAAFLQAPLGLVEFLWLLRVGLFVCLILHIISAVYLRLKNNAAKPVGYQIKNYAKAKLTSRTMLWTGLLVLSGVTLHLLHFTTGTINVENGHQRYEILPTGGYIMDMSGCSDANTCHMAKDACCETKCSDKHCQADMPASIHSLPDGTITIHCCGKDISAEEYAKLTGKQIPERYINMCKDGKEPTKKDLQYANEVLAEVNANLLAVRKEQCSNKPCQTACETKCSDKPCQTACETKCSDKEKTSCCSSNDECCDDKIFNTYEQPNSNEVVEIRHDVYGMVGAEFSNIWVALCYLLFVMLVGFHLNHAIQSAVHTLGFEGPKLTPVMRVLSTLLSIGLVTLFVVLPLGVILNNLLGCNCIIGGI